MADKAPHQPELLPGADLEQDCDRPDDTKECASSLAVTGGEISEEADAVVFSTEDDREDDEHEHDVSLISVGIENGGARHEAIDEWQPDRSGWAIWPERVALAVEKPVNRLTSTQLNPIYHTGTIAVFLLAIVGVTGAYLFFFFQYGYDASYLAVERMESQFIARIIRATHRYASGALVIATLLHAYRTLYLEKFRGPRWLAWITGMGMTVLLWLAGVTGYWLIWDTRAQLIGDQFRLFLEGVGGLAARYMAFTTFAGERGDSWVLFLVLFAIHVILFLIVAVFFYLHIRRLARPRWLPPVEWVVIIGGAVVLVSALFPVGMLPQANLNLLPGPITFDPLFLFYLPFGGAVWFWAVLVSIVLLLAALPWISRLRRRRKARVSADNDGFPTPSLSAEVVSTAISLPLVNIIKDRCTGCTKCALDCPYDAIQMVERHDDKPHKFIAIEDTSLCVSCGICVGSCDGVAVTLGNSAPESLWDLIEDRAGLRPQPVAPSLAGGQLDEQAAAVSPARTVVFTCERHARHGARPYLNGNEFSRNADIVVIALPCVGTVPPDMLTRTLGSGVFEVKVVGCPPNDCASREGNLWAEQRLTRQRVPRLRKAYANAPITAHWLPPNEFSRALEAEPPLGEDGKPDYLAARRLFRELSWRDYLPAALLVFAFLVAQALTNDIPFTPHPNSPGVVQVVWERPDEPFGMLAPSETRDSSYLLRLVVDGQGVFDQTLDTEELLAGGGAVPPIVFAEFEVEPGAHPVRLSLTGSVTGAEIILVDEVWMIEPGQIVRPAFEFVPYRECPGGADSIDPACLR